MDVDRGPLRRPTLTAAFDTAARIAAALAAATRPRLATAVAHGAATPARVRVHCHDRLHQR